MQSFLRHWKQVKKNSEIKFSALHDSEVNNLILENFLKRFLCIEIERGHAHCVDN